MARFEVEDQARLAKYFAKFSQKGLVLALEVLKFDLKYSECRSPSDNAARGKSSESAPGLTVFMIPFFS